MNPRVRKWRNFRAIRISPIDRVNSKVPRSVAMARSIQQRTLRDFALLATFGLVGAGMVGLVGAQQSAVPARGAETLQATETAEAAKRLEEIKQTAAKYTIVLETDPPARLTFLPEPVLRWTNPIQGATDGGVFLWTRSKRPEVVATVYRKRPDGIATERHEFQSLAGAPLKATFDGRTIWAPREAGITLMPIPGAPPPAATSAARLRQIRALARDFEVEMNAGKGPSSLRLLTQPLSRYEPDRSDLLDGALFAFVLTTDPDALLLIEARPAGGSHYWHYGFGRMSSKGLMAKYRGQTVWEAPFFVISPKEPSMPYIGIPSPEQVP
jgi:hypothetical protein